MFPSLTYPPTCFKHHVTHSLPSVNFPPSSWMASFPSSPVMWWYLLFLKSVYLFLMFLPPQLELLRSHDLSSLRCFVRCFLTAMRRVICWSVLGTQPIYLHIRNMNGLTIRSFSVSLFFAFRVWCYCHWQPWTCFSFRTSFGHWGVDSYDTGIDLKDAIMVLSLNMNYLP